LHVLSILEAFNEPIEPKINDLFGWIEEREHFVQHRILDLYVARPARDNQAYVRSNGRVVRFGF
jgi:hypothetical protein